MKHLKDLFGGNLRQYGMLLALILLIFFFQGLTGGKVLTTTNAQNILNGYSYVFIMAIGMLFVIIMGHIDLSVGSVAAVVGICMALSIRNGETWYLVIGIPFGVFVGVAIAVWAGRKAISKGLARLAGWGIGIGAGLVGGGLGGFGLSLLIQAFGIPWWGGVLIGIGVGVVIGCWHGTWLAFVGVPGFITTLAGMMLFRGVNRWIGKAESIGVPEQIQFIGGGYLPEWGPVWGPGIGVNNSTALLGLAAIVALVILQVRARQRQANAGMAVPPLWTMLVRLVVIGAVIVYLTLLFGHGLGGEAGRLGTSFPITGCILVVMVLFYNFFATRTPLGRSIYAVGGNRFAAELTGISNKKVYFVGMLNMSILAAIAGIMFIGRSHSTGPADGTGWELDAIAAVFIGGAAVTGGVGTVTGAVIGGMVMAVLNNGLYLYGVGSDLTMIIKGLVLLAAVAFDLYSKRQGKPSIIGALMKGFQSSRGEKTTDLDPPDLGEPPGEIHSPVAEPQDVAGSASAAGVMSGATAPTSQRGDDPDSDTTER